MRKTSIILMLLLALMLCVSTGWGVVSDYTFSSNLDTYTPLVGGAVHGSNLNDNEVFNNIPLGFDFTFNSLVYSSVSIAANGFIAMGPSVATSNTAISSGTTNNVIVALNRDIKSRDTGSLSSGSSGIAPNRVFTIQWFNYRRTPTAAGNDSLNFQIKLFETTNVITFNYGYNVAPTIATAPSVQCGLRGADNTEFFNRSTTTDWTATATGLANNATCSLNATVYPPNGLVFTWTPPTAGTPPNPAQIVSPTNNATNVALNVNLNWITGGGAPTGFKVYFGTDNPPTNIENGIVQTGTTYNPVSDLTFSTIYYWQIVPTNSFGDAAGCPVWSFTAMPNPLVTVLPYNQNWDSVTAPAVPPSWTVVNANADAFTWVTVASGYNSAPNAVRCSFNSSSAIPMNDWLISPPIQLLADTSYRVRFQYKAQNSTVPEKLEVKLGDNNNPAALTTQLFMNENIINTNYILGECFFTTTSNGIYYIGWHGYSNPNSFYIYIDDISIAEYVIVFNPPLNLQTTGGTDSVILTWDEPDESIPVGYKVFRDDELITPTPVTGLSYTDNTAVLGTIYSYYVTAVYTSPTGESVPSEIVEGEPFNPPTNLSALVSITDVILSWDPPVVPDRSRTDRLPTRDLLGLKIYRDGTLIETLDDPSTDSYTDVGLQPATYSYTVTATYTLGESEPEGPVQVIVQANFYPPSNLVAVPGADNIVLTWNAPTPLLPSFFGYRVYRDGVNLTHTPIQTLTYTDDSIEIGVEYAYYIVAVYVNPNGVSIPSNTVLASVVEALNPVTELTYTVSQDSVFLEWNAPARALLGYKVYRDGIPYYNINNPAITSIIDSGLPNGSFTYYVTAVYTSGESDPCDPVTATINVSANPDDTLPVSVTALLGNYPNPFNPETSIAYNLKSDEQVVLEVYNLKGQKIRTLVNGTVKSGRHSITWRGDDDNGRSVTSGVYYYKMSSGKFTSSKKMILLK